MFRLSLFVLACLAFSAQADECCSDSGPTTAYIMEEPARRHVVHRQRAMKLVRAEPEVEYVTESAPRCTTDCEEPEALMVEPTYEAPRPAHYEQPAPPAPTPAPMMMPKITIQITETPQLVTEPAPAPKPQHYEAPADPCHPSGCQETAYEERKTYVPVKLQRLRTHRRLVRPTRPVRPVYRKAAYVVQEASSPAPCESVCHTSAGCCQ